jgi:hypothetical protein
VHQLALQCTRVAPLIGRLGGANPMQACPHRQAARVDQLVHRDFCKMCFEDIMAVLYDMES